VVDLGSSLPRFVAVGALSTCVGLAIVLALRAWTPVGEVAANAIGYLLCIPAAFVANGRWTFGRSRLNRPMALRYAFAVVLAYLANVLVLWLSLEWLKLPGPLAQGFALTSYSATLFLLSRYQVFGSSNA
jgi:putative flippase GtrA